MIEVKSLTKSFNAKPILSDVNFRLERNQISFLIGANGTGKTTFVKLLAHLIKPDSGIIQIDEFNIPSSNDWKKQCKFVFDDTELVDDLNALDHISLIGYLTSIPKNQIKIRAEILCNAFNVPFKEKVREMSKGQQCKVNILMNLLTRPSYFILDEPFVYLDIESKVLLINLLKELADFGTGILITTNDLSMINHHDHSTYLLKNGSIENCKEELNNNQNIYERFISLLNDSPKEINIKETFNWLFI